MDTRWKSKLGQVAWVILFTIGLSGTLAFLNHWDTYMGKSYFETDEFKGEFETFLGYLHIYEVSNLTSEELKGKITVSKEEIKEYRYRNGDLSEQISSIQDQFRPQLEEANTNHDKKLESYFKKQRDKKIEDIQKNFESDKYVKQKVTKEKEEQIDQFIENKKAVQQEFQQWLSSFEYYLQNNETAEVFTNLTAANKEDAYKKLESSNMLYLQNYTGEKNSYLSISDYSPSLYDEGDSQQAAMGILADDHSVLEGKIGVPKALPADSMLYDQYKMFKRNQQFFFLYSAAGLIALCVTIWQAKKHQMLRLIAHSPYITLYKKIPVDLKIGCMIISAIVFFISLGVATDYNIYGSYVSMIDEAVITIGFATFITGLTLIQLIWLISEWKESGWTKGYWKTSLTYRFWHDLEKFFHFRSLAFQYLILLIVIFASGFGVGFVLYQVQLVGLYLVLFMVVTVPVLLFSLKKISYFNRILLHSSELAAGNMEPDLKAKGSSALAGLARNINTLKHGVKSLQKSEAKSERLKTELITNVSHDLRTPLTSIITYTELLKTPDLDGESREAYVQIIDKKSKRLKVLIEDLFEASKMASGSIELMKARVDIVQLLQQALAEYDEAIEQSTLQIRMSASEQPIDAYVDGQKIWRVFDNLIGNILKYSLENTRVYIAIEKRQDIAVLFFKNVSKYELGGNTEELFERFKRGDTSRHTEGSGLGLAIAKSIIDLHEGSMDVEADGDLFKVTIELDLA
ncbi:histidine kinase dimerization/phospho-acceptor domain-containing protein [Fictibacillus sp. KU28468]|uniref:histidine kinase dimerization/phospho-acceptor domain-containing protein n=1 Tax=Fictibacillus sp. KU28468 TaxID=2991053 RepID=UPI00223E4CD5|nr:histidine kinase dimerization/phospho-acceptor domain-containing protein [Fictibacillus sp. KU28468]UZJ77607.1 ATP-binding protein [Fictibacillus sp. KU28468]